MPLVLGLIAFLTGVTIVGGLLFGVPAILVGISSRRAGRAQQRRTGKAVAGIVLGALGLAIAGGIWLYIRDDVQRYQDCRKESVSIRQDQQCTRDLEHGLNAR